MIRPADRKITEIFRESAFTLSAEIVPPRNGSSPTAIVDQIERLASCGSMFMAVTKGAGGSLRGGSLPIAQTIKDGFDLPCIAHFTCRDLLPEEVENQLMDHHFLGLRNILALRGDPPMGTTDWKPREGSYEYAYQLVEQIRDLNSGKYLAREGFTVDDRAATDFCIGVACYPEAPTHEERIGFFKQKVLAGAEYTISQMLFDPDAYARFLDEAATAGCAIPVLPGTRILKSQDQADRMAKRFSVSVPEWYRKMLPATNAEANDAQAIDAFLALTEQLRGRGAPGMHVFVLSDTELAHRALGILKPAVIEAEDYYEDRWMKRVLTR